MAALAAAGVAVETLMVMDGAPDWYHPGRSGTLRLGPKTVLAVFGELHPRSLQAMDIKGPLVGFEVFLDRVPLPRAAKGGGGRAKPALKLSALQAVERDFAFIVEAGVAAETLIRAVRGADKALIARVSVFAVFACPGVDRKSTSLNSSH